jgi:hypothetical protein
MTHPRELVREAVVTLLTNATSAGARVTATRVETLLPSELPSISVYTPSERVRQDSGDTAPRELTRDVKVDIRAWVLHTAAIPADNAMDAIAEQIETAMDADRYLGGAAGDAVLENTETDVVQQEGVDPLVGVITLTYSVTYRTVPAVGTFDDFLNASSTTEIVGGVPDTAPTSDEFVVQEIAP